MTLCDDCSTELHIKNHHYICPKCGLIHEDLSITSEYRDNFHYTYHRDKGGDLVAAGFQWYPLDPLGTKVGGYTDLKNNPTKQIKHLIKIGRKYFTPTKAFKPLQINTQVCKMLKLPPILKAKAKALFLKKFTEETPNSTSLLAACLYSVIKKAYLPISITRVVTTFNDRGSDLTQKTVFRDLHIFNLIPKADIDARLKNYIYTFTDTFLNSIKNLSMAYRKMFYEELVESYSLYKRRFKIGGYSPITSAWFIINYTVKRIAKLTNTTRIIFNNRLAVLFDIGKTSTMKSYAIFERQMDGV